MREMDEYSFNLIPSKRRSLRGSVGTPFILLVLVILLLVQPRAATTDHFLVAVLSVALLITIYIVAVPLWMLFRRDPVLRFTREGIEEAVFGGGEIPWTDIVEIQPRFELSRGGPIPVLDLRVRELKTYLRRIPVYLWLALPLRTFRRGVIPIPFSNLDGQMEDAVDWIRSYHPDVAIAEPVEGNS
jgi:hypothetical protein